MAVVNYIRDLVCTEHKPVREDDVEDGWVSYKQNVIVVEEVDEVCYDRVHTKSI